MSKESILKAAELWAISMVITIGAILLCDRIYGFTMDIVTYLKGMAVPMLMALMSLIAVKKVDIHARKNDIEKWSGSEGKDETSI